VSGSERGAAGRTSKRLDPFGLAMFAIADERVNVNIGDAEVRALLIGTGEARGVDAFGAPRRLFTSRQGRTDAGSTSEEAVEA
jgi:hypothetical protein